MPCTQAREEEGTPLVSVMMPAYNTEKYVGEAIESIINQTYTNWELLCVDDGSTDRTLEIMQEYAAKDPRIRVYTNEENRGRPYTRNRALDLARGEILAVQDADDISTPERLESGVRVLTAEPGVAVVGGQWMEIDEYGRKTGRKSRVVPQDNNEFSGGPGELAGFHCCHGSLMMREDIVRSLGGYDEFFALVHDRDLVLRIMRHAKLKAVALPWYYWRKHGDQATIAQGFLQRAYAILANERAEAAMKGHPFDLRQEFDRISAKVFANVDQQKQRASAAYNIGIVKLGSDDVYSARDRFTEALKQTPLFVRALLGYALTFLPGLVRRPVVQWYFAAMRRMGKSPG